jgi:ATP-binding cassette, subfamily G (WHITE), member 2, PDR
MPETMNESNQHDQTQQSGKSSEEALDSHGMSQREHSELTHLARQFSRLSSSSGDPVNPFLNSDTDPELNPNSGCFSPTKWASCLLQITSRDPERYPHRSAGVSFRRLSVSGYGTAADYQMTVASLWLKATGWAADLLGFREKRRIDILRDLEGLVRSGEMLVVLGRPGRYVRRELRRLRM